MDATLMKKRNGGINKRDTCREEMENLYIVNGFIIKLIIEHPSPNNATEILHRFY